MLGKEGEGGCRCVGWKGHKKKKKENLLSLVTAKKKKNEASVEKWWTAVSGKEV